MHRPPCAPNSIVSQTVFSVRFVLIATVIGMLAVGAGRKPAFADGAIHSALWGEHGELWTPQSRLPDFSMAGYRRGEEPFREPAESISVVDFGAVPNDGKDDTAAFQKAIAAGENKVVLVPPGRFVLNDILRITHSNTVLRGAGSDRTTLVWLRPGDAIEPRPSKTDGNSPTTGWSWALGLIEIDAPVRTSDVTVRVAEEAKRGDTELVLQRSSFVAGDEIELTLFDDAEKSLLEYLYRGQPGNISGLNDWRVKQIFRVRKVEGERIVLDRPLRFDVRSEWRPTITRFVPAVTDVAVEGFRFEFPPEPYKGHFKEKGYNPVEIGRNAAHCVLRDLLIRNADSGPYVKGAFCTLEKIILQADPERYSSQGVVGHHGISLYGHDLLCTDFAVEAPFIHDLTVQSAIGCVYAHGKAVDLSMDHHRWAPYENLYTDIDAGKGNRLFASSGGGMRGNHTAGGETFWGIRTAKPVRWPTNLGIDAINIVGIEVADAERAVPENPKPTDLFGRWLESCPADQIVPRNLYEAMRARRSTSAAAETH
ncbi:glycosyl hydrolase family 28-related protein [Thermostilla marina]